MKKVITLCFILFSMAAMVSAQFAPPTGGWDYTYAGDVADTANGKALDGTFEDPYTSGSFAWDLTGPGENPAESAPGGAGVQTEEGVTFLRIQDAGDPRDFYRENPLNGEANHKVAFMHSVGTQVGYDSTSTILDDGITINWRARVPSGGEIDSVFVNGGETILPYPAVGDGYENDGGQGQFNIAQTGADGVKKLIGFNFMTTFDHDTIATLGAGLYMNLLNGNEPNNNVGVPDNLDEPEVTLNMIELDPTQWQDFWMQISVGGSGTHQVKVWINGNASTPKIFYVTARAGSYRDWSYIWMGHKNSSEGGAIDIDFFSYKKGIHDPVSTTGFNNVEPRAMELRNYPNPVVGTTSIAFRIEKSGYTTLKLYNPVGQMVQTIMAKDLTSGSYSIPFEAANQAAGTYFYQLENNGHREIARMVIMK